MKKCKYSGKYFRWDAGYGIYLSKVFCKSFNKILDENVFICSICINIVKSQNLITAINYMMDDCFFRIIRAKQITKEDFLKILSEYKNDLKYGEKIKEIIRNEKMQI